MKILVTEESCKKVVEVQRKSGRVMPIVLILKEKAMKVMCAYQPLEGRSDNEKDQFYNQMTSEWDSQNPNEWFFVSMTLTKVFVEELMVLRVCMMDTELAKEMLRKKECLSF